GGIMISPVLAAVVTAEPSARVQLIPVRIRGHRDRRYFIVNVLSRVAALDRARSRYRVFSGTNDIACLSRLALHPLPEDTPAIFHLEEMPTLILVSRALRDRLVSATSHPGNLIPAHKFTMDF